MPAIRTLGPRGAVIGMFLRMHIVQACFRRAQSRQIGRLSKPLLFEPRKFIRIVGHTKNVRVCHPETLGGNYK